MNKRGRVVTSSDSQWMVNLLADVAFVVLDKLLEPIDHVHFAAICKLWHSLAKHYNHTTRRWPKLLPPMLILPRQFHNVIYSLSEAKPYKCIKLTSQLETRLSYYRCCGHGWLMQCFGEYSSIQFLNSFTGTMCSLNSKVWPLGYSTMVHPKVILFGDPCVKRDNSFMVVAFYTTHSWLGFITGGHLSWSLVETMVQYAIADAIFYNGQVYAVDKIYGKIVSFDVNSCTGSKLRATIFNTADMRSSSQSYLVESTKGKLLHVRRFLKVRREQGQLTVTFKVYKLVFDDSGAVVKQVKLKSIGDQTLFVGDNQSMSVPASSFSWCRPNSIYYTNDSLLSGDDDYKNFIGNMGIFNLKEKTTTPLQCYPQHSSEEYISKPAFWILPPINGLCYPLLDS